MKFLFDLFPIFLFFLAFKVWDIYVATGVATAASVPLGSTGLTAAFAAGPYNIDNKCPI